MKAVRVLLILSFLVGLTDGLNAEEPENRWEVFGQFGGSFFTDSTVLGVIFLPDPSSPGDFVESSTLNTVSITKTGKFVTGLRFYFTSKDAIEAAYSYSPGTLKSEIVPFVFPPQIIQSSAKRPLHMASFNYVRYGPTMVSLRPFVTGGFGFARFARGAVIPTQFVVNFGGGVDVPLNQRVTLRFEYRDFIMGHPLGSSLSPRGLTHNHGPSAGLAFRF